MIYSQFKRAILTPVLSNMAGYSEDAEMAISMIVAHESLGGEYIEQAIPDDYKINNPNHYGLGICQMEGWVHDDIWANSDNIFRDYRKCFEVINGFEHNIHSTVNIPDANIMCSNHRYAVFMARKRLHMDTKPLPNNPYEMAKYLKDFWNSEHGAATPDKYLNDWQVWTNQ